MKANFPIEQFRKLETPFYYYDTNLLRETLNKIKEEAGKYNKFCVHYAVKANANPKILGIIRESGLGADCVSGGEIKAAIKDCPRRLYAYGGYEHVADYFLYAVYHAEQTSDDGNKYAEQ